jgi:hypothetical protein
MRNFLIIFLVATFCYGGLNSAPKPLSTRFTSQSVLPLPDLFFTGGPGRHIIFAEDGHSVAIINLWYIPYPGTFQVFVAYSTDKGNNWVSYGPLSTFDAEMIYSGLDAEDDFNLTGRIHFAWSAASGHGGFDSSWCFYAQELSYPDGLITSAFRLPTNWNWYDIGKPCIGVKDSFVIITAGGNIWRSTSYGETWNNTLVFPGDNPHFRFGNNGYMFFFWVWEDTLGQSRPYYCESFDYGLTLTQPQLIWENQPPYPNANCWNQYDCEVVGDTPMATVRLDAGNPEYSEIWVYRPDSGGPGNWRFRGIKLAGEGSTAPQVFAYKPTFAADDSGNTFIGYRADIITSEDTVPDFKLFARPAIQDTWYEWSRFIGDTIGNSYLEFAHNAPLIAEGDSTIIGMLCSDTNHLVDFITLPNPPIPPPGIAEVKPIIQKGLKVAVSPNPFRSSVQFTLPSFIDKATLSIFDVTGKLVTSLKSPVTSNCLVWDGRNSGGIKVNAGVYFYNVSTRTGKYQGKIILTQ